MTSWRNILSWKILPNYLFEVRMKEDVSPGSRTWGTSNIPSFTVQPGDIGYVTEVFSCSYRVIWEGYPKYPHTIEGAWTVSAQIVEKI